MAGAGGRGFSMLEMLVALVCLGVGLAGAGALLGGSLKAVGMQGRRMAARWQALAALEGAPAADPPFRVATGGRDGLREAQVSWPEGAGCGRLRVRVWRGRY